MTTDALFDNTIYFFIHVIEIIGIFIVVSGALKAFVDYIKVLLSREVDADFRHNLGSAMITGLEFKMAAEILRTVIVRTPDEIIMLASIIIIRGILSMFIKKDLKDNDGKKSSKKITGIKIERE